MSVGLKQLLLMATRRWLDEGGRLPDWDTVIGRAGQLLWISFSPFLGFVSIPHIVFTRWDALDIGWEFSFIFGVQ